MPEPTVQAHNPERGENVGVRLNVHPDKCPICHHHVFPQFRYATIPVSLPFSGTVVMQAVFQCTRRGCLQLFFGWYECSLPVWRTPSELASHEFKLTRTGPIQYKDREFPPEVAALSSEFIRIYNQAAAAESYRLVDIAGPGYGKALEFLIKDYLIAERPDDAEAIKREFLGDVIKNRVTDPYMKSTAERAAWLRNDETHYERRWQGKDTSDLKTLIQLTVNWIHNSLLTRNMVAEMSATRK